MLEFEGDRADDETIRARWANVAVSSDPTTAEVRWVRADGSLFDVELRMVRVSLSGEVFILTLVRDVTARKAAEARILAAGESLRHARDEAVRANLAKDDFLARMSHELRTPLTAILGYAEIVGEGLEEEQDVRYRGDIERIRIAGTHLLALIDDVLDVSKLRAGKVELDRGKFDLCVLAEEVVAIGRSPAIRRSNELGLDLEARGCPVFADRHRVRQILVNLVGNACKFTEHGRVLLRVTRHQDAAQVVVADTGRGIDAGDLERIFLPFEQGGGVRRAKAGVGLGLHISRQLAELHGGSLSVQSTLGQGSTFTLRLPLAA
jgi:signal transduction histidine kinase